MLQIPWAQLLQWLQRRNKTTLPSLASVGRPYKSNKTGILLGCFHPSVLPAGQGPVFFCYGYGWAPASLQGGPVSLSGSSAPTSPARCSPAFLHSQLPSCCLRSCSPAVPHWLGPLLPGGSWESVSRSSHLIQTQHLQGNAAQARKPDLRNRVSVLSHVLANFSLVFCPKRYSVTFTEKQSNSEEEDCERDSALGCGNIPTGRGRSSFTSLLYIWPNGNSNPIPTAQTRHFHHPHVQWQVSDFPPDFLYRLDLLHRYWRNPGDFCRPPDSSLVLILH